MWFLRRQPSPGWWAAVGEYESSAPGIIRELLRSTSVVCDRTEALQALAWARAHPCWRDDEPALEVLDTIGEGAGDPTPEVSDAC
ncbi:MAG TPA: hypothetical protein VFO31_19725 [Vicinamibacterales bacterium]|nr:hypothetical protein [Vicinamibacterales bacterium]